MGQRWYGYRKERDGWEVWELAPCTGDRRILVGTFRSAREARAFINKLGHTQNGGLDIRPC